MLQKPYAIATHWWMGEIPDFFSCRQTGVFQQEGGDGDQRVSRQGPWQPDVRYIVANHCRSYCWEFVFQSQGRRGRRRFGIDHQNERHEIVQVAGRRIVPGHHQELAAFQSCNWTHVCWIIVSPNYSCHHPTLELVQELKACEPQRSHGGTVCSSVPRHRPVVDVHHYESKTCMGVFTGCWRQFAYGSLSIRSAYSNLRWRGALQPPYGPGSILWTTSGRQLRETHQNHVRYSLPRLALQIDFDQLWRGEHDDRSTQRSCHPAREGMQQPCALDLVRPTSIGHCHQERHARCFGSGVLQSSPCLFYSSSSASKFDHGHGIQMPKRHDALGCIW